MSVSQWTPPTSFCLSCRNVLIVPGYELPGESHHNWIWNQFTPPFLAVIVFLLFVKQSSYKTLQCRSGSRLLHWTRLWCELITEIQGWSDMAREEFIKLNIFYSFLQPRHQRSETAFRDKICCKSSKVEFPFIFSWNNNCNCNTYIWLMVDNFLYSSLINQMSVIVYNDPGAGRFYYW